MSGLQNKNPDRSRKSLFGSAGAVQTSTDLRISFDSDAQKRQVYPERTKGIEPLTEDDHLPPVSSRLTVDSPVLCVRGLTKGYDSLLAVDGISFSVEAGQIVGLLGPNGAGKSTTINMILGILEPSSGTIEVFGRELTANRSAISARMNFSAVYAHMPPNLTVRQNLHMFGLLYGVPKVRERVVSLLRGFDLENYADSKAGQLSSGEASRLSLAKAIINEPHLLLLDEPTASLDPSVSRLIREKIRAYVDSNKTAVLWTSHNMREIEEVCDHVLFLSHGHILLSGHPKELPATHGKKDLEELFITVAREPLSLKE